MPGEPAVKLALAFACEADGDLEAAAARYGMVWMTDRSFVSGAFGLARTRLARGEVDAALAVLDQVPVTSRYHREAQIALIIASVRRSAVDPSAGPPDTDLLARLGARLERLDLDQERRDRIATEVLEAALAAGCRSGPRILGAPPTEDGLRRRLEQLYRELARMSGDPAERRDLVDRANAVRPRTWL